MTDIWPNSSPGGYYNSMFDQYAKGMEYLGGAEASVAVPALGPITFRPRDMLFVIIRITNLSTTGIPALRFNGDSGANYWDRNLTAAAGGATWSEVTSQAAAPGMLRLGGVSAVTGRVGMAVVMNQANSTKNCIGEFTTITGAVGTVSALQVFSGEWVNTVDQINSLTLVNTGTGNFGVDTGFGIFGKDFS